MPSARSFVFALRTPLNYVCLTVLSTCFYFMTYIALHYHFSANDDRILCNHLRPRLSPRRWQVGLVSLCARLPLTQISYGVLEVCSQALRFSNLQHVWVRNVDYSMMRWLECKIPIHLAAAAVVSHVENVVSLLRRIQCDTLLTLRQLVN